MATFHSRLGEVMGERGYENGMRRSVQTVILYEAHRCIADRLPSLRPFQRKLAFWDQALALVNAMDILPHQKEEIMWRTGTSKEPMQPETAWKRMKLIEKEVDKIREKIKPLCIEGRSHEEVCRQFIQEQYEAVSGQKDKPYPPNWEHAHNNVIMAYRLYFRGGEMDPTFPEPNPPKEIVVPAEKPKSGAQPYYIAMNSSKTGILPPLDGDPITGSLKLKDENHDSPEGELSGLAGSEEPEDRRLLLKEVREHLDLLKEFEGVISQEELNRRKRDLFMALPPAPPPPFSGRKGRRPEENGHPSPQPKKSRTSEEN